MGVRKNPGKTVGIQNEWPLWKTDFTSGNLVVFMFLLIVDFGWICDYFWWTQRSGNQCSAISSADCSKKNYFRTIWSYSMWALSFKAIIQGPPPIFLFCSWPAYLNEDGSSRPVQKPYLAPQGGTHPSQNWFRKCLWLIYIYTRFMVYHDK